MTEEKSENKFDIAAEAAKKELNTLLEGLSEEEKIGAMAVLQWQASNYMQAGHKRLGRILVKVAKDTTK